MSEHPSVHKVKSEGVGQKCRVLQWSLLLPCDILSLETPAMTKTHRMRKENFRYVLVALPSSSSSSSEEWALQLGENYVPSTEQYDTAATS